MNDANKATSKAAEAATKPPEGSTEAQGWRKLLRDKRLLIGGLLLVVIAGAFWMLTGSDRQAERDNQKADTTGYEFLTMAACNEHFKDAGYTPKVVNETCMRLDKELKDGQISGSANAEPMPLDCADVPIDQWYRTDDTFVVDPKDPNTMYVNVERKGVHKSTDGGKTWTMKVNGIVVSHKDKHTGKKCYGEYPAMIIDPTNSKRLLLATSGGGGGTLKDFNTRGGGVYETTDGGENWKQTINDKMNAYTTHALVFDPSNPQSFYYGTAASPASNTEADPDKIWVTKGLIYNTADNGKNWLELPTGFIKNTRLMSIMIDPRDPKKITAATNVILRNASGPNTISKEQMGIIQSTDGGSTWKRIDDLPKYYDAAQQAEAAPKNYDNMFFIAATNDGGSKSFYSNNGGKNWAESGKHLDVFAYDPHDASGKHMVGYIWQCYSSPSCSKTLYQSTDAGKTWSTFGTLPAEARELGDKKNRVQNIVWHPTDKNSFFLTGAGAHIWKTSDNGATWKMLLSLEQLPK